MPVFDVLWSWDYLLFGKKNKIYKFVGVGVGLGLRDGVLSAQVPSGPNMLGSNGVQPGSTPRKTDTQHSRQRSQFFWGFERV